MPEPESADQPGRHRRRAAAAPPAFVVRPRDAPPPAGYDELPASLRRVRRPRPPSESGAGSLLDRLALGLLDRLPPGASGVRVALGRYWWLPVLVAVAALAVAIAAFRFDTSLASPDRGPVASGPAGVAASTTIPTTAPTPGGAPAPTRAASVSGSVPAPSAASPSASGNPAMGGTPPVGEGPSRSPGANVVVDVVGRVRHQGVVRLPAGSRVGDAVAAAGGSLPSTDTSALNLARPLADGQQIRVGLGQPWLIEVAGDAPGPAGSPPQSALSSPGAPMDLNTATIEQLDQLPGVGPATAQKIIDWRTQHGRFGSVDDLEQVSGIGPARLAQLRPRVRV